MSGFWLGFLYGATATMVVLVVAYAAEKRQRPPRPVPEFDVAGLRDAADHLTGWTYTGIGDPGPGEPPRLLRGAAYEIERLNDLRFPEEP